ncbi:MAG: hypothetical protein ABJB97_00460 [Acidobacteriota bacterium]
MTKLDPIFSVFGGFDLLEREDKRRLLNTLTPSIVVANYKIDGVWLGLNKIHANQSD